MSSQVSEQIQRAPKCPGVYLMKDASGKVLYVGKASSLRNRLKSYLHPDRESRPSIVLMMPKVCEIEWVVTRNEKEAVLLENSFIKNYQPYYNISLKDDKSYVKLGLSHHPFPRLFVTRSLEKKEHDYFGPYSSATKLRETLSLLQRIFKVRDCSDSFFQTRNRPCLRYQIKRCSAPCATLISEEKYQNQVLQVKQFLLGNRKELVFKVKKDMERFSQEQNYEEAAKCRDQWMALRETLEPQQVESHVRKENLDAIGLSGDLEATLIEILKIREGRVVDRDEFFIAEPVSASSEILRTFVQRYYLGETLGHEIPGQLFLPQPILDREIFETLLADRQGKKVRIQVSQRGRGKQWVSLAQENALSRLQERKRKSLQNQNLLEEVRKKLRLRRFPHRVEGYDISCLQGSKAVGSMVVFVDGEPDKSSYRFFRIRTLQGPNDFGMLKEVFERRFGKAHPETLPDLVIVDGGKGQLHQLLEVFRTLKIQEVDGISIAKEKTGTRDRIFLPGQKNPLFLSYASPVLQLIQRVRDESHRFGLSKHQKLRTRDMLSSLLSEIPGVGPKRKNLLLQRLGSLERIQKSSLQDLQSIPGMTFALAKAIHEYFQAHPDIFPDPS